MVLVPLYRVCKFAWQGFWRNFWLSMVTISIMVLAILTVNALIGLNVIANSAVTCLEKKIDISVYFDSEVSEEKVLEVREYMEKLAQVASVRYVSPQQALQEFRQRHAKDAAVLESLEDLGGNPLDSTLIVTARRADDYPAIVQILKNSPYRELVAQENFKNHQETIRGINLIANRINRTGIVVTMLFGLIATLIVFNTIRVAIYTHREEIAIMKLVGASNAFITAPFVMEGFLYAIVTLALAVAVTFPLLNAVQPYLQQFFPSAPVQLVQFFMNNSIPIFGSQVVVVLALNMIGSTIAIRRYLRV